MRRLLSSLLAAAVALAAGCESAPPKAPAQLLATDQPATQLRSAQTRVFDIADRDRAMRAVLAALQDLDFIIERASGELGLITAGRFASAGRGLVEVTVVVRPAGEHQTEVRVNAMHNRRPVNDPETYRDFFVAVRRALLLE